MSHRVSTIAFAVGLALTLTTVALAAPLKAGVAFNGVSKNGHYGIEVFTACSQTDVSCHSANLIGATITFGATHGRCPVTDGQLEYAPIKHGSFKTFGEFSAGGDISFKVTGKVVSATKVTGRITGPARCGGDSSFAAKLGQEGGEPPPPHGV